MPPLTDKPAWVLEAVLALITVLSKLILARTDEDHEAALMEAAESVKVALDKKKFGG